MYTEKPRTQNPVPLDQLAIGTYVLGLVDAKVTQQYFAAPFVIVDENILRQVLASGATAALLPAADKIAAPIKKQPGEALAVLDEASQQAFQKSSAIFHSTTGVIKSLMSDVRAGKQIEVADLSDSVESIVDGAFENPHALSAVSRIKTVDDYTFEHSVSVAALMVAFAREMGINSEAMTQIAIGSLLHDIGKLKVPDEILNKPGKLTEEEFKEMRRHVEYSRELLLSTKGLTDMALDIALQHHERPDGKGYPKGLGSGDISLVGSMAAIVDVYDALTSKRVYKKAWEPTEALRVMLQNTPGQFQAEHVQRFIRFIGIYPVGSWVELSGGEIGIVSSINADLLRPTIAVGFCGKTYKRIPEHCIDLSQSDQQIVGDVVPEKLGIDETQFQLVS